MISDTDFAAGLGVLADRFGRELSPATARAYYAVLSRQLNAEQFERAVTIVLSRFEYKGSWPGPGVFLDAVTPKGAVDMDAAETLRTVRSWIRAEGYAYVIAQEHQGKYARLPSFVRRAVAAVGLDRIRNTTVEHEPFLLKEFAQQFAAAKDHADRNVLAGVPAESLDGSVAGLIASLAESRALPDPHRGPRDVLEQPLTPEQVAEVRAAKAWIEVHPRALEVIGARLRRDNPMLDPNGFTFRRMLEAACIQAWKDSRALPAPATPQPMSA